MSDLGDDICSPFFDESGSLHIVSSNSGNISVLREDVIVVHNTNGQPSAAAFDKSGALYITDFAHGAVLIAQSGDDSTSKRDFRYDQQDAVVAVYEDKILRGPSSIAFDQEGNIFFTDSGPFGETGVHAPLGSLFVIADGASGKILKPIVFEKLAGPCAVAISYDQKFIYVAEMMTNRVLRFFQKPSGVYHGSVFYQMSGGVGPSAVACDERGNLYVASFEIRSGSKEGKILVLSKAGECISMINTVGPEISGLALWDGTLYITEQSTGSVLKYAVNEY